MEKRVIIMSAVVGALGVLSAILGFAAEETKPSKNSIAAVGDQCIYPPNPALGLGICASVILLVAQITAAAAGGCCGCCCKTGVATPSKTTRVVGILSAIASWIAAVLGWLFLVAGALWYANVERPALYSSPSSSPKCLILEDGIFAKGAGLTLAATVLSIISFILLRGKAAAADPAVAMERGGAAGAPNKHEQQQTTGEIAMGHPQFSPPQQGYAQPPPRS